MVKAYGAFVRRLHPGGYNNVAAIGRIELQVLVRHSMVQWFTTGNIDIDIDIVLFRGRRHTRTCVRVCSGASPDQLSGRCHHAVETKPCSRHPPGGGPARNPDRASTGGWFPTAPRMRRTPITHSLTEWSMSGTQAHVPFSNRYVHVVDMRSTGDSVVLADVSPVTRIMILAWGASDGHALRTHLPRYLGGNYFFFGAPTTGVSFLLNHNC